jgi:hypothetical protein
VTAAQLTISTWCRVGRGKRLRNGGHPSGLALCESANPCDFAPVAMLGPLGLQIFEASAADIADLGEEHGHRVL